VKYTTTGLEKMTSSGFFPLFWHLKVVQQQPERKISLEERIKKKNPEALESAISFTL